jgi:hypothetical protein
MLTMQLSFTQRKSACGVHFLGPIFFEDSGNAQRYFLILLFRSRLCHYSVGGAWLHLCFYKQF